MVAMNKGLILAALDMMAKNGHDVVFIEAGGAVAAAGLVDIVKEYDDHRVLKEIKISASEDSAITEHRQRRNKSDRRRDRHWRLK